MSSTNEANIYHSLQKKGARRSIALVSGFLGLKTDECMIHDIDEVHRKRKQEIPCSLDLEEMIGKIVQHKDLWDEFRHELQKRKVVTNFAMKEVLMEFLIARMKNVDEPAISIGEIIPLTHVIKNSDTKTRNEISQGKMDLFQTSLTEIQTPKHVLPQFDLKNMTLGNKLGNGSQSVVYEIESLLTKPSDSPFNGNTDLMYSNSECEQQLPEKIAAKLPRHDSKRYKENVQELLHESKILSSVDHPNIIKIHGISSSQSSQPFFLILDRLSCNFEDLLKHWASKKNNKNILKFHRCKEGSFQQRLKLARDIATAMKHLHEKDIMHLDLKPENIGFDSQGELKLFDFGFARKLQPSDRSPDGKYKLKGGIGTCRYMAPEVAKYEPYNELADIYSFGILMWQILKLEKPFKNIKCKEWMEQVVFEGKRPDLDESWPAKLQTLLSCCWSEDISERPSFDIIIDVLDEI